jgi:ketosteroid isomerase-like protein
MCNSKASTPEQALSRYETALCSRSWEAIEPLIDDNACFVFSEGTYFGRKAIQDAIVRTFATIEDETYRIGDIRWVYRSADAALCMYEFAWSGIVSGQPCSGQGRGTSLLTLSDRGWQVKHEHLGPTAA